ncbi:MAG: chemotaxis protein CheA, partial [Desulfobacterales bacterium]|nr:chemotaxis protein CheA [Desulfobacterales bacterium]
MIEKDELLETFIEESTQHLQTIEPDLLELEESVESVDYELINRIFRAVHSIKGAAGFFGLSNISELSHAMESVLSLIRDKKLIPNSTIIDALLTGIDLLRKLLTNLEESDSQNIFDTVANIKQFLNLKNQNTKTISIQLPDNFPKQEKTGVKESSSEQTFTYNEEKLKEIIQRGFLLYSITLNLHDDILVHNKTPYQFVDSLSQIGQIIHIDGDIEEIHDANDTSSQETELRFIFATVMEQDLVSLALSIPEGHVNLIPVEEYKQKYAPKVPDSIKKRDQEQSEAKSKTAKNIKKRIPIDKGKKTPEPLPIDKEQHTSEPLPIDKKNETTLNECLKKNLDQDIDKCSKQSQSDEKIRVNVNFLNELINIASELVLSRNQLMQMSSPIVRDMPGLNPVLQQINRITTELHSKIMQMRMQPIFILFNKFQRIVRDIGKKLGKEVKFVSTGTEVELDKTIIEALSDPLTHLIRNSIDHGIELPHEREAAGKPRFGTIELKAYHQAGLVYLEVIDNGKGINIQKVSEKALTQKLVTSEELNAMSRKDILKLIFSPGLSTASEVTDVSGRGVGMDVVKTNIEQLGGIVDIETSEKGTRIILMLPLTLAIVSGLIINCSDQYFIIPEANLEEYVRLSPEEIDQRINSYQDSCVLRLREMLVPLINLKELLLLGEEKMGNIFEKKEPLKILITKHSTFRQGLIVDDIENIEEIVVKPLPRYMKKMKFLSGASIMGNGKIALIIDISGLVDLAKLNRIDLSTEEMLSKPAHKARKKDLQSLLIFNNHTTERFAVPLELIQRVERVPITMVEEIEEAKYIQYQGKKLKLI